MRENDPNALMPFQFVNSLGIIGLDTDTIDTINITFLRKSIKGGIIIKRRLGEIGNIDQYPDFYNSSVEKTLLV